ncbi:MAG: YhcG family protein [Kiritimatiellia bacterium]
MNDISIDIVNAVKEIKSAIVRAQARVSANANAEMLSLYFGIGRYVSYKTQTEKWGTGVIDTISVQLQKGMPGLHGFSGKSMRKMRQFYEIWQADVIWPPTAAKLETIEPTGLLLSPDTTKRQEPTVHATATEFLSISFSHHMEILSGTSALEERLFYIGESVRNRWSKRQLRESIKRDDFHHRGSMPSNFKATIPDATLARKTLTMFRDEYLLDFVNLDDIEATTGADVDERVVEKSIVANIRQFITEFGKDFSFIGNQYRVEAAGHEHFIDLLFFNRELNALVAVELKKGEFKPIYLGQLNLYLQALDDTVKKPHENTSVGIILCQSADKPYVEYAIRDYNKPLGVATYRTADEMPETLKRALPPIDELRKQLEITDNRQP